MTLRAILIAAMFACCYPAVSMAAGPAKLLADGCAVSAAIEAGNADQKYRADQISENLLLVGLCVGYIEGLLAGHSAGTYGVPENRKFCLPAGVTTDQIARLLARRMEANPQLEHLERLPFVMGSLVDAWPCGKGD